MSKTHNPFNPDTIFSPHELARALQAADVLPRESVIDSLTNLPALEHDRRAFLRLATLPCLAACAGSCMAGWPTLALPAGSSPSEDSRYIVEAQFYEKLPYKKTRCKLCPRECVIDDRERGYCGVRENRGGTYYSLVHSRVCAAHIDPIEKKPLFHFCPGTLAFSVATAGCNVNCKFCQNWDISQVPPGAGAQ